MEVRIKQGEEMIDATIEMVDGVMVVSPKEVKFEPRDGDIITIIYEDNSWLIAIFEENYKSNFNTHALVCNEGLLGISCSSVSFGTTNRYATEEEKQKLFDKLAEEGWEWDAEGKELVKLKWEPVVGEDYYAPSLNYVEFKPYSFIWDRDKNDLKLYEVGWCFKTEEECQLFCQKLNEAISQVEP